MASIGACIFGLVEFAQAQTQNQTRPCTDPAEGVALSLSLSLCMYVTGCYNIVLRRASAVLCLCFM
ncbi:hypothetical protein ACB094_11G030500 [Castanea mollissima]